MFGTKKITVCTVTPTGMTASIFSKAGKGLTFEKKVEHTSFAELKTSYGITHVRIMIPEGALEEPILKAASDTGMIVTAYEPPSTAMARMASHIHEPFLLIYPPVKPEFICAIQDGNVLEVQPVDPLGSLEDTKHAFIDYITKTHGVTVRAIATNVPDPVIGLATKPDSGKSKKAIIPLPLIIGIIIAFVVGIGLVRIRSIPKKTQPLISPTLAPTPTASNVADAPIVRTDLKVEVQNGSGVAGFASKGKKVLEDAGYTAVTTANADTYDYLGVTVKGKTAAIAAFVLADIKETYKNASASGTVLDSSSPVDAVVILGK